MRLLLCFLAFFLTPGCGRNVAHEPIYVTRDTASVNFSQVEVSIDGKIYQGHGKRYTIRSAAETGKTKSPESSQSRYSPVILYLEEDFIGIYSDLRNISGPSQPYVQFGCELPSGEDVRLSPESFYFYDAASNQISKIGTFTPKHSIEQIHEDAIAALKNFMENQK